MKSLAVIKNYAYTIIANDREKTVYKVGGITLNYLASELVNFEVNKAMIFGLGEPVVILHRSI